MFFTQKTGYFRIINLRIVHYYFSFRCFLKSSFEKSDYDVLLPDLGLVMHGQEVYLRLVVLVSVGHSSHQVFVFFPGLGKVLDACFDLLPNFIHFLPVNLFHLLDLISQELDLRFEISVDLRNLSILFNPS